MKPAPVWSGLRLCCGQCGEGKLFAAYLKFHPACPKCGRDMRKADTGDGPAFFVSFGALILMAPFMFILPMMPAPVWLRIALGIFLAITTTVLILGLLPIAKAILLNLQLHHLAGEARRTRDE
jgi:uncharacterized protein (DUF983 family)